MDKFDKGLLFYYSENRRLKLRELAALLKKSPPRLKYNLRQLEKEKILYHPYALIDYSFFGLLLFRVYFKGGYVSEKDKENILQKLREHPYIVSLYELSGEFDLVIEMESLNASRFNKELKKLIEAVPTLNNYKIVLNIVSHIYPQRYLLPEAQSDEPLWLERDIIVGGDRRAEVLSPAERLVLLALLEQPAIRFTKLAKAAGLNIKTALSLFKNLKKRRILKGFKSLLDFNRLGIHKYRLFLKLHNLSAEREAQLMEYFLRTPEVVLVHKTIGDWEMEIDLEALDKSRIRYLIARLREDFTDLIETFNSLEFYQYYKKTFLSRSFFQEEEKEGVLALPPLFKEGK